MADKTNISWADATHNHWLGCAKVSPACDFCYAEHLMDTRMRRVQWGGPGKGTGTRALTSEENRRKPLAWNRKAATAPGKTFVFCSSLSDVFDNAVPPEWRRDLFDLIRATPNLTWLLLTKRPGNIVRLFDTEWDFPIWPRNAAIGCTVVTQEEADRDIPKLLAAKAALKPAFAFLSMEPLLGPVDLTCLRDEFGWIDSLRGERHASKPGDYQVHPWLQRIDWVITGGETDQGKHKARDTPPDWFRSIRDQCLASGVTYHHKQMTRGGPIPADLQIQARPQVTHV